MHFNITQLRDGKEITQPIKVKISGDGAKFTRSFNIILFSFSFPGLQDNVLSGMGMFYRTTIKINHRYTLLKLSVTSQQAITRLLVSRLRNPMTQCPVDYEKYLMS